MVQIKRSTQKVYITHDLILWFLCVLEQTKKSRVKFRVWQNMILGPEQSEWVTLPIMVGGVFRVFLTCKSNVIINHLKLVPERHEKKKKIITISTPQKLNSFVRRWIINYYKWILFFDIDHIFCLFTKILKKRSRI